MRTLLLALTLTLALVLPVAAMNAETLLELYARVQQERAVVEEHPKAYEPIDFNKLQLLMQPYDAQRQLQGKAYKSWALRWNGYHDEKADRTTSQRVLYGTTITTTRTTRGRVTTLVPRFWVVPKGVPGVIRYNPFVSPKD